MSETPRKSITVDDVNRIWDAARRSDITFRVQEELLKLHGSPRLLILVTHGFIELVINALVEAYCKSASKISGSNRDFPHSVKLVILHEMDILSDHSFQLLNWLRKLRNDAAHEALFTLAAERLHIFECDRWRDPNNFGNLCEATWNLLVLLYRPVVFEKLSPTFHKELSPHFAEHETIHDFSSLLIPLNGNPSTAYRLPEKTRKSV